MTSSVLFYVGPNTDVTCNEIMEQSLKELMGEKSYQEEVIATPDLSYLTKNTDNIRAVIFGGGKAMGVYHAIYQNRYSHIQPLKKFILDESKGYYGECMGAYLVTDFSYKGSKFWSTYTSDSHDHLILFNNASIPERQPNRGIFTQLTWKNKSYHDFWLGGPSFENAVENGWEIIASYNDIPFKSCEELCERSDINAGTDKNRGVDKKPFEELYERSDINRRVDKIPFEELRERSDINRKVEKKPCESSIETFKDTPNETLKETAIEKIKPAIIAKGHKVLNAVHTSFFCYKNKEYQTQQSEESLKTQKELFQELMIRAKVINT